MIRHICHDHAWLKEQGQAQEQGSLSVQPVVKPIARHEPRSHNRDRLIGLLPGSTLLDFVVRRWIAVALSVSSI